MDGGLHIHHHICVQDYYNVQLSMISAYLAILGVDGVISHQTLQLGHMTFLAPIKHRLFLIGDVTVSGVPSG